MGHPSPASALALAHRRAEIVTGSVTDAATTRVAIVKTKVVIATVTAIATVTVTATVIAIATVIVIVTVNIAIDTRLVGINCITRLARVCRGKLKYFFLSIGWVVPFVIFQHSLTPLRIIGNS
jgi:hypothetical protein